MDNAYDMGRKRGQEEGRKEIERLMDALEKYGRHQNDMHGEPCKLQTYHKGPCTCGFDQELDERNMQQALKGK